MLNRLFPNQFDNGYRGAWFALVLFAPVMFMKFGMGAGAVFNTAFVVSGADGLSTESYGAEGTRMVYALFKVWGLAQMLFASLVFVALIRYRAMAPLLLMVVTIEHVARKAIFLATPFDRPGGLRFLGIALSDWINYGMLAALLLALVLSLTERRQGAPSA